LGAIAGGPEGLEHGVAAMLASSGKFLEEREKRIDEDEKLFRELGEEKIKLAKESLKAEMLGPELELKQKEFELRAKELGLKEKEIEKKMSEIKDLASPIGGVIVTNPEIAAVALKDKTSLRSLKARSAFITESKPTYERMRELVRESGAELSTATAAGSELDQLHQKLLSQLRTADGAGANFTEREMELLTAFAPQFTGIGPITRSIIQRGDPTLFLQEIDRAEEGAVSIMRSQLQSAGMDLDPSRLPKEKRKGPSLEEKKARLKKLKEQGR
jgi:hypothetical protein